MASKKIVLIVLFFGSIDFLFSQNDSVLLPEVTIGAYLGSRPVLSLPASVSIIDSSKMKDQAGQSLVPVLNSGPGVRMEERSPGSYRLSIRGSLIRSPFGIRNVKVYVDEFPLTNASGETYLNLLDLNSIRSIEVLKGPDGSLFGANSGGVVRLNTIPKSDENFLTLAGGAGSYGLIQENVQLQKKIGQNIFSLNQAWQKSDGYRDQSALNRKYFQVGNRLRYAEKAELRGLFFFSDLEYETPGGLTVDQFNSSPRQARPATKFVPGAVEQNASIRNRTFFGGLLNEAQITPGIKHVFCLFGSQTNFQNPFITNFEIREEGNAGVRTWVQIANQEESSVRVSYDLGGEFQEMQSRITNYGNRKGVRDTVQARDDVGTRQGFIFTRLRATCLGKINLEGSLSYNFNVYSVSSLVGVGTVTNERVFTPQLMPRVSANYIFHSQLALRVIVSHGYSPPTLQEIRASNYTINTTLDPEKGWNNEFGFRFVTKKGRLSWDLCAFEYKLDKAIVRKVDANGQEIFENTGGTKQRGVESAINYQLIRSRNSGFFRMIEISNAATLYDFKFTGDAFNGNELTGVPGTVLVTALKVQFPKNLYLFAQHNYTSRIPLNDLNSEYAQEYELVLLKIGWRLVRQNFAIDLNGGVDNLLDQQYSLGNDLNAIGNRYYNAAARRNFFARVAITF